MKKTLVILAAMVLASTVSFAQSKGDMFVGGQLGFKNVGVSDKVTSKGTSVTTDYPSTTNFNFGGSFHYMITDNLAIGLGIGYNYTKVPDASTYNNIVEYFTSAKAKDFYNSTSLFNIAPSLIYFKSIGNNFSWAPELQIGLGFGSNEAHSVDIKGNTVTVSQDVFAFGIEISPLSFQYSINKHIAVNAAFGTISYGMYKVGDSDNNTKTNTFNLGLNPDATFTLRYFF